MSSGIANSRLWPWVFSPLVLLATLCVLRPLEARLLPGPASPAAALAGSGETIAVLGGLRTVVAGGLWLRTNLAWERRDEVETTTMLQLTVAADDRPLTFWLNGARMIAYDFPTWRSEGAPAAVGERNRREQAQAALSYLERGLQVRGPAAEIVVEMANIRLRALRDREGAARLFRQAAELPGAPYYAARIHAELLRELGRPAEALAWLKQIQPGLPENEPAAQRAVVLARIKGLEQEVAGK